MKKLFAALALCVSTVAFAQSDMAQDTEAKQEAPVKEEKKGLNKLDTGVEATDLRSQKPGDSVKKAQQEDGMGGSGAEPTNEKTVVDKTKGVLGMDDKEKEPAKPAKKKVKNKKQDLDTGGAGEAGQEMKKDAKAAAKDAKAATKEAAEDTEDAAKDTQNKMNDQLK